MPFCFICSAKLYGERPPVCSSITPHSNTPYPEKIVEMLGEEFVVIVTPTDQMCMRCSSGLNYWDKCNIKAKLFKNAIVGYIKDQYGILPIDQAAKDAEIANRHVMAKEQLDQGQRQVLGGLTVKVSPTVTTAAVVTPVQTPLKLLKTQQQQHRQQNSANTLKLYNCGFCTFQSKELGHFRFHMLTHENTKELKNPILNQAAAKPLTPVQKQKKTIFKCKVCFKIFDSRINCFDHIQKEHIQPTPSTSSGEKITEYFRLVTTKAMKPEPFKIHKNNQEAETCMDIDKNQQDNNKDTVDMDMMSNDNTPTKEHSNIEEEKNIKNAVKEKKLKDLRKIQLQKEANEREKNCTRKSSRIRRKRYSYD